MLRHVLPLLTLLTACADLPDIGRGIDADALPSADLAPLGPILARADGLGASPVAAPPAGRVAALRARAAGLRGPVLPPATRARFAAGIPGAR